LAPDLGLTNRMREGMSKPVILVVEDEENILEFLRTGLSYEGYTVLSTREGAGCLKLVDDKKIDLILLDIMLEDIDGFEVCRLLRVKGAAAPILMLTAKKDISDRVMGLDLGADDYLTKPFSFEELLARIRALLRRSGVIPKNVVLRAGGLVLNPQTREVRKGDEPVRLTPREFELLEILMSRPRRVFTRETLLNRIWGYNYIGDSNTVDVHLSHLRQKIGDKPPRLIRTLYGVGYAFYPDEEQ